MKQYFILAAAALTLAACSNDDNNNITENNELISLAAAIGTLTRATLTDADAQNTQFASGKTIKVEAYKTGESSTYTTGEYTANGSGGLTGSLYYPATGENIDICAYYPSSVTSSSTSFSIGATQTSASNYQTYDLMYATKLTNKAKGSTHALTFNHALSKIVVTIANGDGVTADNISSLVTAVKINNTKPTAGFTISGGAPGAITASGTAADIDITGTTKTSHAGIIVPQEVAAGTFITVTYNGNNYTYSLASAKTFVAGKVYTYALTLSAAGLSLSTTSITDWTSETGATETITL